MGNKDERLKDDKIIGERFLCNRLKFIEQILIIFSVILAFLTAAGIDKRREIVTYFFPIGIVIAADIVCIIVWIWLIKKKNIHIFDSITIIQIFHENKWCLFVLLYTFFVRILQFSNISRWDANAYYSQLITGCNNFDFTMRSFIRGFSVASHPTFGYLGLLGIGEFLASGKSVGMIASNMMLTVLIMYCVFRIFEKLLPEADKRYIALATCIISSIPVFLGTFSYCNPDMGVALFSLFMIYFFLYNKRILMFFAMFLTMTSKETGVLMVGGFAIGVFLWRVVKYKDKLSGKIRFAFKEPLCSVTAILGVVGVLGLILYLARGGYIWSIRSESKPEFSTVTFIPEFIWNNLKQFFIFNFNWISTLILFFCCLLIFIKKRNFCFVEKNSNNSVIAGLLGGYLFSVLFFCFYITFTLPRYHIIIDIIWTILMLLVVGKCIIQRRIRNVMLSIFCIVLLLQSYVTIDPLSVYAFMEHSTGNGVILTTQHKREGLEVINSGDYSVYNHQYTYKDEAFDQILREVGYDEDMDILCFVPGELIVKNVSWDKLKRKRTYSSSENTIPLNIVDGEAVYNSAYHKKAVYIYIPQSGGDRERELEHLHWYYDFLYKGSVEMSGGVMYYWVCERI